MASRLRPRSTSELIDVLFELLRRHYASFLTIVAAGFAPAVALGAAEAFAGAFGNFANQFAGASAAAIIALVVVGFACVLLVNGALIHAASDAYLEDRVDVADAFRRSVRYVPIMSVAYLLTGLTTLLGYAFLIIPGIYLAIGLFAVPAIVLLEGRGPSEAMGRSLSLTKGRKLAVFGALFITGLIAVISRMTIGAVGGIGGGPGVGLAAQIAGYVAFYPLTIVMAVLLYYDARIRVEGFDIERAAAALGSETA